jgi:tetratricopeptide (TPR) repeat protein
MRLSLVSAALLLAAAAPLTAQIPARFENLEVLPKDIGRDQLMAVMRAASLGLGVRCHYCHVAKPGGSENSLADLDFKSDQKPEKEKARAMMRMVHTINQELLAKLPDRSDPPVNVQCVTCHRGSAVPSTLDRVLAETIAAQGVDSAVAQYRGLREQTLVQGRYNFSEQTLNDLANQLAAQRKTGAALRMLELNQEFNPRSAQIDFLMGEIHRERGEREAAIARYRAALEKQPNHREAGRRLQELGS